MAAERYLWAGCPSCYKYKLSANKNQKGYNEDRKHKTEEEGDGSEHISVLTLC
jgi:hypothetical protein